MESKDHKRVYFFIILMTLVLTFLFYFSDAITGQAVFDIHTTKINRRIQPTHSPGFGFLPRDVVNDQQLNFLGENKNILVTEAGTFILDEKERKRRETIRTLKQRYPSVKLLMYEPSYFRSPNRHANWDVFEQHKNEWFRKNPDGSIKVDANDIYFLDYTSPSLIDYLVRSNLNTLGAYDFDGIFIDNLAWEGIFSRTPSLTREEWVRQVIRSMQAYKDAGKFVLYNGLRGPSEGSQNNNADFIDVADGALVEHFCFLDEKTRVSSLPDAIVDDMKFFIETLPVYTSRGKTMVVNTYNLNQPLQESYTFALFCYAGYLMMAEPNMMYRIRSSVDGASIYEKYFGEYSMVRVGMGNPMGKYEVHDGLYRRYFENGVVFWNPEKQAKRVDLEGYYDAITGRVFDGIIGPRTGRILLRHAICVEDAVCSSDEKLIPCAECTERLVADFENDEDILLWGGARRGDFISDDPRTAAVYLEDCKQQGSNQNECVTIAETEGNKVAEIRVPRYTGESKDWSFMSLTDYVVMPRKNNRIKFKVKGVTPGKFFKIIVEVVTKQEFGPGRKIMYQSGSDSSASNNGAGPDIYIGLDENIENGKWHSIERDIDNDIKKFFPNDEVYSARYLFVVGGSQEGALVYLDDIQLGFSEEYVDNPTLLGFSKSAYEEALMHPLAVSLVSQPDDERQPQRQGPSRYEQLKSCLREERDLRTCRLELGTTRQDER